MATPTKPPEKSVLADILRTWTKEGDLSAEQMEQAIAILEGKFKEAEAVSAGGSRGPFEQDEMVEWNALHCSDNKPVRINGERFSGLMRKPYHVYHQWLTTYQADWIAAMEFYQPRGGEFVNDHVRKTRMPIFTPPRVEVRRAS